MKKLFALILFSTILFTACKQQTEPITDEIVVETPESVAITEEVEEIQQSEPEEIVYDDIETVESQPTMPLNEIEEASAENDNKEPEVAATPEELEKIAQDLIAEIYGTGNTESTGTSQNVQAYLDSIGATPDQGAQRPGVVFGQGDLPDSLKGAITLE